MCFDRARLIPHMTGMDWTLATLLPLITLGALGAVVPMWMARRFEDSLPGLARALAASVGVLVILGSLLFVLLYRDAGADLAAFAARPVETARHFLGLGLKAALVWGPVTALTAIALGQAVEARRGRRMAARDDD